MALIRPKQTIPFFEKAVGAACREVRLQLFRILTFDQHHIKAATSITLRVIAQTNAPPHCLAGQFHLGENAPNSRP